MQQTRKVQRRRNRNTSKSRNPKKKKKEKEKRKLLKDQPKIQNQKVNAS
jgi:hypothetical protein